jgi:amino acid transporter
MTKFSRRNEGVKRHSVIDGQNTANFKLSFRQLLAYSFGGMIGSGWLLGAYQSADVAGRLAWVSWLLGGAAMLIIGLVMMELGGTWGRDGGLAWWPFDSSGPAMAMIVVAAIWIFYALNPASEAAAAVQFASHWLPGLWDHAGSRLTATGVGVSALLVILLAGLNLLGLRLITKITVFASLFKVAVPLVVVALLIRSGIGGHADTSRVPAGVGLGGVLTALTSGGVIYAYIGFQAPVDFGGRAHEIRDIPRAVITPIVFGLIFFTLIQVLSAHDGVLGTGWRGISYDSPYARLATGIAGWGLVLEWLIRIDTIVSPLGSGIVFTAALANIIDNVSSQGLIAGFQPRASGAVPEQGRKRQLPWRVLVVNLLISLLFLLFLPDWSALVNASSVITIFVYAVPSISLAALLTHSPNSAKAAKLARTAGIGRRLAPASFTLMTLILYWATFSVLVLGTALTLAGAAVLIVFLRPGQWKKGRDSEVPSPDWPEWSKSRPPACWLAGYFCGLVALGALRHYGPSGGASWLWGSALALALGVVAFYGLVTSSRDYLKWRHPENSAPPVDTPPRPPEDGTPVPRPVPA